MAEDVIVDISMIGKNLGLKLIEALSYTRSHARSECEKLLLDLFSILRILDSANDNAFGFTVAAKVAPRMRDSRWIE